MGEGGAEGGRRGRKGEGGREEKWRKQADEGE